MIIVIGVSHRTAPLDVRESLAFPAERMSEALAGLCGLGLSEAMVLSTCNRVEVYGREGSHPAHDRVVKFLATFHNRTPDEIAGFFYSLRGEAAVRHAFRVAASLDSLVLGEPQILGQVKEAYLAAEKAGSLGSTLNALRNRSLAAAKRARTETRIGQNAVSVSYVAVELARKIFGTLKDKNILLVGAGKMSELAARHLVRSGARATVLGGRSFERAAELASALGGRAAPFEMLRDELARADIVISGTGAPGIVVQKEDVEAARGARHHRPMFLIDIAVPRDIDPTVRKLEEVFLYDLDDLKSVAEANLRERRKEAAAAEAIVEREVREFLGWQRTLDLVPLIVELRRKAEDIRNAEVQKAVGRLGPLTTDQRETLEGITMAIVNKLLHAPTVRLKQMAENGHAPDDVELIRKLLGL